jgi:adenylate cyclase
MKWLFGNAISYFSQGRGKFAPAEQKAGEHSVSTDDLDSGALETWESCSATCGLDRKHAGIFYADIADYTRLTEQDEEGTHRLLVEAIKIMMANVADHNGRVAHLAGDAILAEFKDADSALHCAINVQLDARQWNANRSVNRQVLFRIGVNFGDVISDHGDIYGNAVNLAARLEKLASSGGICVSETVRQELDDHPSYKFVDIGKQYVKNIHDPVRAFWIEIDFQETVDPAFTTANKISAVSS